MALPLAGMAIPAGAVVPMRPVQAKAAVVSERPDSVSAMLSARSQGKRVEDLSQRTELSSTWANPDGTWTTDNHLGVQRFKDAQGKWIEVNLDLTAQPDGSVAPAAHPLGLKFPGRGHAGEIRLEEGQGRSVAMVLPGDLPKPTIDGMVAMYPDVAPGVDVVLASRRTGFEQTFVVDERPAEGTAVSWDLQLKTKGLTVKPQGDGSVNFVDNKNKVISRIPAAGAWDSQMDEAADEHANTSPVKLTVVQKNPGLATLTVTPDAAWLADPTTVFPVTIDPTYASATIATSFDTFVQETWTNGPANAADVELRVGQNPTTHQIARSFLHFHMGSLKGKKIQTAKLNLRASYAPDCDATYWEAWSNPAVGSNVVWTNQPTWNTKYAVTSMTKGSAACPDAWVNIDMKNQVQAWANDANEINQVGLRAGNEGAAGEGWKKFLSQDSAYDPYLSITYNRAPGTPAVAEVAPVSTYGGVLYTSDTTPEFTSKTTDADANTVKLTFEAHNSTTVSGSSLKGSCTTGLVASGSTTKCSLPTALADNATYYVRTQASDTLDTSAWSGWTTVKMAAADPAAPGFSCPTPYTNGTWNATAPGADLTCTITAPGTGTNAPGFIRYTVDGGAEQQVAIPQSTDPGVAKTTVTVSKNAGGHIIDAWAITPSGKSTKATDSFGYGQASITTPSSKTTPVTTGNIAILAQGPAPASGTSATSRLQWRAASSTGGQSGGWNDADDLTVVNDASTNGIKMTGSWNSMSVDHDAAANIALDDRVPTTLELQICTTYSTGEQCTWNNQPLRVLRVPHAFGGGFPTADIGPGQVALWTGEFNTAATDVTIPGYASGLSISRSYSNFTNENNTAAGVFGPGWTASFVGSDAGRAGNQLVDNTSVDGTLVLLAANGTPMVFTPKTGWTRRTGTAPLTTGDWKPADSETLQLGLAATLSADGATFTVNDTNGVTTTFGRVVEPTTPTESDPGRAEFAPVGVTEPGGLATTYASDGSGRVTRILAPVPSDVSCPGSGTLNPGCRAVNVSYATSTTATAQTPGDVQGQVKKVTATLFDPGANGGAGGMVTSDIASYLYKVDGRLVAVTDSRSGLTTGYGYDGSGNLTELTPPGLTKFTLEYSASSRLERVMRANPTNAGGGTATLATVVYDIPTSGAGLPDFSASAVSDGWGQTAAPVYAAALFGPDKAVTTLDPAAISSGDWAYADVFATDAGGFTVNTATYGAGAWQPTWTRYNARGNPDRTLDAGDIAAIKSGGTTAFQAGTNTVYNGSPTSAGLNAATVGSVITDMYGPTRWVTLKNGHRVQARPHRSFTYDQNSPNGGINPDTNQAWALATTTKSGPVSPDTLENSEGEAPEVSTATYGNDAASWKLGAPRTSTTVIDGGAGDITTVTDYDSTGRVIEERQPNSSGTDAGTRKTIYYAAAGTGDCQGKPEWAGAVCKTLYAGQASGQDLVATKVASYNKYMQPLTVSETANGAIRTSTTSYRADGQAATTKVTASNITGSAAVNGTEFEYDNTNGRLTKQWATTASGARVGDAVSSGYDAWGRPTSYATAAGETTTTSYDAFGRVAQVADPKGTTTYGYGNDSSGKAERRGLPTSLTISGGPGGSSLTFTGAYNADGTLVEQKLPGGMTQRVSLDAAGDPASVTYSGQVTVDNADGTTTVDPDDGWLGWSSDNDINGRVRREWTPAGAAFVTDGLDAGAAAAYTRSFTYDPAGRLKQVDDRTGTLGAGIDPMTGDPIGETCQTRAYGFDKNGNRLTLSRTPGNGDGTCNVPGSADTSTKTWSYDAGDRLTGGYVYDALGRQTNIPATDTPNGSGAGNIGLGYYDTDAVASITQNGTTTSFTLDQAGRRAVETAGPTGGVVTSTTTRHYPNGSDNPGWVTVASSSGTSTTRYGSSLAGALGVTVTTPAAGAVTGELSLADPHGDIVATVDIPVAGPSVGITGWVDSDEYGNRIGVGSALVDGLAYAWLGAKERAAQATGLVLMGARVYNPGSGQFTSTDPVYGGNTTAYAYPQDPVNAVDLDGTHRVEAPASAGSCKCNSVNKNWNWAGSTWDSWTTSWHSTSSPDVIAIGDFLKVKITGAKWKSKEGRRYSLQVRCHKGTIEYRTISASLRSWKVKGYYKKTKLGITVELSTPWIFWDTKVTSDWRVE